MNREDAENFETNDWEEEVLEACAAGKWARLEPNSKGEAPVLRAAFLEILLLRQREGWVIHPKGVQVLADTTGNQPALITGTLDLDDAGADQRLSRLFMHNFIFEERAFLKRARLEEVRFNDCVLKKGADFQNIDILGSLFLNGFKTDGANLDLISATIGGQLSLNDAVLKNPNRRALLMDGASIKGGIFMDNVEIEGETRFIGAIIEGQLTLTGAKLKNPNGNALNAYGATINGSVFAHEQKTATGENRPFTAHGVFNLTRATIKGDLEFPGATLIAPTEGPDAGLALAARSLTLNGAIYFSFGASPFFTLGVIELANAFFNGFIRASAGVFVAPAALGVKTEGVWHHCAINMSDGKLNQGFNLQGSTLIGALNLDGRDITGDVLLDDAAILAPDDLEKDEQYRADSKKGVALSFIRTRINGVLQMPSFREPELELPEGHPLLADEFSEQVKKIRTALEERLNGRSGRDAAFPHGCMDFRNADIGYLDDRPYRSWPIDEGRTHLDGMTYKSIYVARNVNDGEYQEIALDENEDDNDRLNKRAKERATGRYPYQRRLAWLAHQFDGDEPEKNQFRPQPYEQLAKTLRTQGFSRDANMIAAEKRRLNRLSLRENWKGWFQSFSTFNAAWDRFVSLCYQLTSRSGYSTGQATLVYAGIVFIVITTAMFLYANGGLVLVEAQIVRPPSPPPAFVDIFANLAFYAFDIFVPLLRFGAENDFEPAATGGWGTLAHIWRFFTAFTGFVMTAILVLTFTGFTRSE